MRYICNGVSSRCKTVCNGDPCVHSKPHEWEYSCEKRCGWLELNVECIEYKKEAVMFTHKHEGNIYEKNGELYQIVQSSANIFRLINLSSGNRMHDSGSVDMSSYTYLGNVKNGRLTFEITYDRIGDMYEHAGMKYIVVARGNYKLLVSTATSAGIDNAFAESSFREHLAGAVRMGYKYIGNIND